MKLEYYGRIFDKNTQIPNFIKIREVWAKLYHENGQTDMTKLIVAVRSFANAHKQFQILPTQFIDVFCIYLT
jgi:hypothetical protein